MADTNEGTAIPVKRESPVNPSWTASVPPQAVATDQPSPVQSTEISPGPAPLAPAPSALPTSAPVPTEPLTSAVPAPTPVPVTPPPVTPPPVIPTTQKPAPEPTDPALAIEPTTPERAMNWRPVIIGLAVVLVLGAIAFGLWFFGIGFGAPANAKVAFTKMTAALATAEAYHTEGKIGLSIRPGDDASNLTPTEAQAPQSSMFSWLPKAMAATTEIPTFSDGVSAYGVGVTFEADRGGDDASQATLGVDLSGLGETLPVTFPNTIEMDIRQVGSEIYLRLPILSLFVGSDSNKWLVFDERDLTTVTAQEESTIDYAALAEVVTDARRVGFERIGPIQTAHYQAQVGLADLLRVLELEDAATDSGLTETSSPVTVDWWMGVNNHLPYKIAVSAEASIEATVVAMTMEVTYSNYGSAVSIVAPDPSEVSSDGMDGLFAPDIESARLNARDAQRKSDLAALESALSLYQNDHGSYPSTGGAIDATDQPTSVLQVLVQQGYLSAIPVDPVPDTYWYGYTSEDGSTYELWSVLEIETDPAGILRDGLYLYIVTP